MTEPSDSSDGKAVSHSEVSRIAVKVPPFWRENPAIWFSQLESQFHTSGIVQDSTKYHTVVASVETEILSQLQAGKLEGQTLMAADVKGQNNCRLVIHDRPSGLNFLVDTGADISVVPPSSAERCKPKSLLNLLAANGTKINTYGTRNLSLNIGLRRIFPWSFIIADVSRPILGADFLTHYGIIIDLKSKCLKDQQTTLTSTGKISTDNTPSITALKLSLNFNDLIREYNDIFDDVERSPIKVQSHNVTHVIQAKGPPVGAKARRLAPDKLIAAKQEFQNLIHKGICSPLPVVGQVL
ncbi:hypothetical protein AVEN_222186-1 [Araneus ventricosus]|uniref:Peptidase A2 domain-containing protein n=1 Tax=Araneus ventricosus TaxID=182803 RepID=A0A4Y2NEY3_ARAVE|nr:hypothetical protein AVEN_222186-1 [Araneus ventricosus]